MNGRLQLRSATLNRPGRRLRKYTGLTASMRRSVLLMIFLPSLSIAATGQKPLAQVSSSGEIHRVESHTNARDQSGQGAQGQSISAKRTGTGVVRQISSAGQGAGFRRFRHAPTV